MGMTNIAARASEVGGTFEVASNPGGGTTVRFSVPCRAPASARPYATRALVWGVVFMIVSSQMLLRGIDAHPWIAAVAVIAAIAVARYTFAVHTLVERARSA
jgi:hypothetical protein